MYQLHVRLSPTCQCSWNQTYHRKIRGRLYQTLRRAEITRYQHNNEAPFTFSDLYVVGDSHPVDVLTDEDTVRMLVASSEEDVVRAVASGLKADPEVTAGSMVFETRAAKPVSPDVGPSGEHGTLTTTSGVVLAVEDERDETSGPPTYWTTRDHTTAQFRWAFHESSSRILNKESDVQPPDDPLFDDYDHTKTYVVDVGVSERDRISLVASKWNLSYEVRDERHRQQLNALLRTGVGLKRSFGFGTLQKRDETTPKLGEEP